MTDPAPPGTPPTPAIASESQASLSGTALSRDLFWVAFLQVDLPAYTRRMDDGSTRRVAQRMTGVIASTWHEPKQRRLALALAAAIVSAVAFARIAEDYLTNDPLARWDVSFARWLSGERSIVGTDFFRVLTFFGSPAVALTIATVVCVVL
jgi:hypothetical protein